jgi:hypothetical protein
MRWSPFVCIMGTSVAAWALATWLGAQTPEDVKAQADREAAEKEAQTLPEARARREIERLDLMSKEWREGTVAMLRELEPADVVKMQIFKLVYDGGAYKKVRADLHFGIEGRQEVEAVLALVKAAEKYEPTGEMDTMPDRVLVVQPEAGEPFEIRYSSGFDEPFGGVWSLALKEALHALSGGESRITIINVDDGQVRRVIHTSAVAPHRGGHSSPTADAELHLTAEKGLTVWLKVRSGDEVIMEGEQPMHYGEAKVFAAKDDGTWLVVLNPPGEHWEEVAGQYR